MAVAKYLVKIIAKKEVIPNFWEIDLERPAGFEYLAGQYVSIKVGELGERRSYSLASFPENKNSLGIMADVTPMGLGSRYLLEAAVGETIEILGPMGMFTLENSNFGSGSEELVFVATGSGIVPIRSMINHFMLLGRSEKIRLHWGMRYENIFWKEEFERFASEKNLDLELVISKPTESWTGCRGHVTDCLVDHQKGFLNKAFYVCGSQRMIGDVTALLINNGVPKEKIFFEKFY